MTELFDFTSKVFLVGFPLLTMIMGYFMSIDSENQLVFMMFGTLLVFGIDCIFIILIMKHHIDNLSQQNNKVSLK